MNYLCIISIINVIISAILFLFFFSDSFDLFQKHISQ